MLNFSILLTAAVSASQSFREALHFAAGTSLEQLYERRAALGIEQLISRDYSA
jgi:hypothetical protein